MNSLLRRTLHDQDGQVLVWTAILLTTLLGAAALSIDIGFVVHAQRELQASTNAAASAGALDLGNNLSCGTATKDATSWSGLTGDKNAYSDLTGVSMVSGYPLCTCLSASTTAGLASVPPCDNTAKANALAVKQTVAVPTFFGKLFNIRSITLTASALSLQQGGQAIPANIVVILDTTESMTQTDSDPNCKAAVGFTPSKVDCAKWGVRSLLQVMYPCQPSLASCGSVTDSGTPPGGNVPNPYQQVGLLTFPGLGSNTYAHEDYASCQSTKINSYSSGRTPDIYPYAGPPTTQPPYFTIVPPSSDYRACDANTCGLSDSSYLVQAVYWAGLSCNTSDAYGIQDVGGEGTYYAGVITEAQSDLSALTGARAYMQNAIILLSDGAANAQWASGGPTNGSKFTAATPSSYGQQECHQAINAAQAAASTANANLAGLTTWVYAVAYGATNSTSDCSTDTSPTISPCTTLGGGEAPGGLGTQGIASDANKFFSDDANGCASQANGGITSLSAIFDKIAYDFQTTRLLPFSDCASTASTGPTPACD